MGLNTTEGDLGVLTLGVSYNDKNPPMTLWNSLDRSIKKRKQITNGLAKAHLKKVLERHLDKLDEVVSSVAT